MIRVAETGNFRARVPATRFPVPFHGHGGAALGLAPQLVGLQSTCWVVCPAPRHYDSLGIHSSRRVAVWRSLAQRDGGVPGSTVLPPPPPSHCRVVSGGTMNPGGAAEQKGFVSGQAGERGRSALSAFDTLTRTEPACTPSTTTSPSTTRTRPSLLLYSPRLSQCKSNPFKTSELLPDTRL